MEYISVTIVSQSHVMLCDINSGVSVTSVIPQYMSCRMISTVVGIFILMINQFRFFILLVIVVPCISLCSTAVCCLLLLLLSNFFSASLSHCFLRCLLLQTFICSGHFPLYLFSSPLPCATLCIFFLCHFFIRCSLALDLTTSNVVCVSLCIFLSHSRYLFSFHHIRKQNAHKTELAIRSHEEM